MEAGCSAAGTFTPRGLARVIVAPGRPLDIGPGAAPGAVARVVWMASTQKRLEEF
jgi:hypothetical protein